MLPRLSSSFPSVTTSLARGSSVSSLKLSLGARFNTTEAAPEAGQPKKRGVPLAQSLGDISIVKRPRDRRRDGSQRQDGNRGQQQRRSLAPGDDRLLNPRAPQSNGSRRENQRSRNPTKSEAAAPSMEAQQNAVEAAETEESKKAPVQRKLDVKIELGNLDQLFGPPTSHSASKTRMISTATDATPSQARIQLLLEKTAGDYSRHVPRPFPTTDVLQLGPAGVAEFVLSRRRDVGLKSRQHVLEVVQKFTPRNAARATS